MLGETVMDGKVVLKDYQIFCAMHDLYVKNPQQPTKAERDKINSNLMKDFRILEEGEGEVVGKICPKCSQIVLSTEYN